MDQLRTNLTLDELIERIKSRLLDVPGKTFPPNSTESKLSKAAVALILLPESKDNDLLMLLIQRKKRASDPWSDQMAFPGGRYAEKDQNVLTTAIREVMEETSIDLREFSILGALDELVSGSFAIRVTPYVALSKVPAPNVRIDPKEVQNYFWIPLSFFENRDNMKPYLINRLGKKIQVPSYPYEGNRVIWGMTLRIIENLMERLQNQKFDPLNAKKK